MIQKKPLIYIAGPDLFLLDWPERAAQAMALCAEHGLEAILPVPATVLTGPGVTETFDAEAASRVFQSCREAVRKADGVIANLTPFRGSEPDSGTVTECAMAYAWGNPLSATPAAMVRTSISEQTLRAAYWPRTAAGSSSSDFRITSCCMEFAKRLSPVWRML